ncbi:glycoside hydrolase family 32 protein [Tanticharoenia sakaeratensis]|uniref:beta-fructofuranosidase n=1 Tax=Tanticharoenia sakaeratensis NBRC 103193 TaxID=1231623 RepID=A0A0D6ML04_9PROT|nr:glycoside hydrolase family 32 protein [Tanticharoenia sakaeratensis]GAN54339.1 sucrose-6-phosphate hydrolase [Tanticharoenia sakaeratensis NBRC 103193]GBQ18901.1 hypothetical protein AA103193_0848 [Tanticharoenia sakaeratensis NBRC 103193]
MSIPRRWFLAGGTAALATGVRADPLPLAARLAADPLRPQYHFIAPHGWMNDPCGPIYVGGRYHMFYQWNPDRAAFGDEHWGHATSPDLVHWHHEAAAMAPTPGGADAKGVFSGSVVIDGDRAVALYTGIEPAVQCMAVSDLGLMHWTRQKNAILEQHPPGIKAFRDPQVWRDGSGWSMVLGGLSDGSVYGIGGVVLHYRSADLQHWTFQSVIYGPSHLHSSFDDTLECPDFFQLGDRWVLLYSISRIVWAAIGTWDGRRFTPERVTQIGHGLFYAARSMTDKNGQRVLWGWISETMAHRPAALVAGWAGAMSLPRILTLGADSQVRMQPHPAIASLEGALLHDGTPGGTITLDTTAARISLEFSGRAAGTFSLQHSGTFLSVDFNPTRAGSELIANEVTAPLPLADRLTLDILLDASVVEIFASTGMALVARAYGDPATPLRIVCNGTFAEAHLRCRKMTPICTDRLTSGGSSTPI